MKKIIRSFSLLFLIAITFIGCTSNKNAAKKVAQEFGINFYTVDSKKVVEYNKWVKEGEKMDIQNVSITKTGGLVPHTQEYINIIRLLDKKIQPLMTEKGYESISGRFNTLSAEVCARSNYTSQVTAFILDKNLYGEKENKAGYYYEAKLKFISTNGNNDRTDTAKGYIGLLKENGHWKVSVCTLTLLPELYNEEMLKINK